MSYADPLSAYVDQRVRAEWCDRELEGRVESVAYHDRYNNIEPTLILSIGKSRIAVPPEHVDSIN